MWELNFENKNKLHMSIGAGLVVAGFLIILSISLSMQSSVENAVDRLVSNYQLVYTAYVENNTYLANVIANTTIAYANVLEASQSLKTTLLHIGFGLEVIGFIFFFVGYRKEYI